MTSTSRRLKGTRWRSIARTAIEGLFQQTAGIHSLQAGTGPLSAIVVGFVAGGFTLSVGQCAPSWLHAQESIIDGLLTKSAGNAI
jgi:hypothetical protein